MRMLVVVLYLQPNICAIGNMLYQASISLAVET